jgi:hypothetical protein
MSSGPQGDEDELWTDVTKTGGRSITIVTRRQIFDYFRAGGFAWFGELSELTFLSRLYPLETLPSDDYRFKNAAKDIWQHRVNNPEDWPNDWIFTDPRLRLGGGPDDVLLEFLAQVVHPIVRPDKFAAAVIVEDLNRFLHADGWQLIEAGLLSGRPVYAPARVGPGVGAALRFAHQTTVRVDSAYISRQVTRMEEAVESDPELAIGTSKDFVETVCKTILDGLGTGYAKNDDLLLLVRKTTKALGLSRDDVDSVAPAAETIKRLLSNLAQIAQGTAELRNSYGTGHGRPSGSAAELQPRHARLAVGAAATLASFLYDTYEIAPKTEDR